MVEIDLNCKLEKSTLNEVFKRIGRIKTTMVPHISDAMNRGSERLVDFANRNVDVGTEGVSKYRPEDSISNNWDISKKIIRDKEGLTKIVYNNSKHAKAVEFGTLGGIRILPVHSPWLLFEYEGVPMKRAEVKGQPPKLYTTNALNQIEDYMNTIYKTAYLQSWHEYSWSEK